MVPKGDVRVRVNGHCVERWNIRMLTLICVCSVLGCEAISNTVDRHPPPWTNTPADDPDAMRYGGRDATTITDDALWLRW